MTEGQAPANQSKKARLFLIIGVIFLFLMGLTWSLDGALANILFGIAIAFIFLGLWHRPRDVRKEAPPRPSAQASYQQTRNRTPGIDNIFKPGRTIKPSRVFIVAVSLFAFLFFTIIFFVMISENEYSLDESEYFQLGEQFRANGNYDSANLYYQYAISLNPEYAEAWAGKGHAFFAKENYDSALISYERAQQLKPDFDEASYYKALMYYYKKNYSESLREAFALMRSNETYYDAQLLAGDNYYIQQRYDSAIHWYELAYGNGMRGADLCHIMAYIYDTKAQQDKAIQLYQEALSYDSTRVAVYTRLGELIPGSEGQIYRQAAAQYKADGY